MFSTFFPNQGITLFIIILAVTILSLLFTRRWLQLSFPYFFTGLVGLILGLWIGSLVANAVKDLPGLLGQWLPLISQVFITVGMIDLFLAQARPLGEFFQLVTRRILAWAKKEETRGEQGILVDTSALIDGRMELIAETGFIADALIIPRFVLQELQIIADSADALKRSRGKRGIEVLMKIKQNKSLNVVLTKDELGRRHKVDDRLIHLALEKGYRLLTVDYNLNQVASIAGVRVVNIHELAQALKPVLVPGEEVAVKVVQKGKEKKQGVGYMPDGTMIVVENGEDYLGDEVICQVDRIFQTVAGKMIFVTPKNHKL